MIEARDYRGALPLLQQVVAKEPKNADAYNLIGYATRKSGDPNGSLQYYNYALTLDPKHLGARVGILSVLHTWGSALTHHPHVHMIVPGGGISLDGTKWVACRPGFFLPVRVLSRLFRRLFLDKLVAAHQSGQLQFFNAHAALVDQQKFAAFLAPLRSSEWVVYSKRPFGGPKEVLRYLARYTHRVAISNRH